MNPKCRMSKMTMTSKSKGARSALANDTTDQNVGKRVLAELQSSECRLIIAGGIVNPFGPTVAGLLLLKSSSAN